MTRRDFINRYSKSGIYLTTGLGFSGCLQNLGQNGGKNGESKNVTRESGRGFVDITTKDTKPKMEGKIAIQGLGDFSFTPSEIKSIRSDIFNEGYFSVFDVLVHLGKTGEIEFEHHFDDTMNTNIIDSINGIKDWWYYVYYDGGWRERSVFRLDHYPVKDKMYIRIYPAGKSRLEPYYETYREEVERRDDNGGSIIIPDVLIMTPTSDLVFKDVEVKAHDFRSDVFKKGAVTAIDTIASLSDIGEVKYDVKWYESIGSAEIVKSYYVEVLNDDSAFNRCGFVYEAGPYKYRGFAGNHIHLQSDIRVLNSPEYEEWFWICI